MGSNITLFVAILLAISVCILQPQVATSEADLLSPLLSPIIGDICNRVGCGKGKCKMSSKNDLEYECECEPGWRKTLSSNSSSSSSDDDDYDFFKFLPCVIPNCTLNSSCSEAAPSPQPHGIMSNTSIFEPCRWANCGGGMCNKTSGLTYACHCKEGYNNLFNNTAFPCFKQCSIGGDCPHLGFPTSINSTPPSPSLNDTGSNQGCSRKHEVLSHWMTVLVISMAAAAAL